MVEDYTQDVLDAEEMITDAGELVSVTLAAGVVADPDKPWKETLGTPQEWEDVPICYIPAGSATWRSYMNGTDVPEGALVALLPGNVAFDPVQEMFIHSGSRGTLKIDKVLDVLAPGPVVIMYTVRLVQ